MPSTGQFSFYSKNKYWRDLGPNAALFFFCRSPLLAQFPELLSYRIWTGGSRSDDGLHLSELGLSPHRPGDTSGTLSAIGPRAWSISHLPCGCCTDTATALLSFTSHSSLVTCYKRTDPSCSGISFLKLMIRHFLINLENRE